MSYKQWNNAFVKYFFDNDIDEEIILYADRDIINKVGEKNNLGDVEDFLKAIIVNNDNRKLIYGNNIDRVPNGNVAFNRRIQSGSIFDFALFLSEHKSPKTKLPFLNYVILAIYAYSDLEITNSSYYHNLNTLISNINFQQKKISSNNIKLDDLFNKIKLLYPRFKNELIGNLAFMGLLKYQVVLSPKEKYEFEETLFKHKITILEDSNYHSFANKFLSVVPNHYNTIREKIKLGGNDPVYARWFLNKGENFSFQNFSSTNPNVAISKQVGEIALVFNPENEKHLYLSINTACEGNINIKGYQFFLDEKREDGFSTSPVILNNKKEVSFKNYDTIETEDYKFSFLPLKRVNFFQKNSLNHYQQVLNPVANTPTYVVVKNETREINNWEKWKNKNTAGCGASIDLTKTESLFTENYVLYKAKSINKEYYTKDINIAAIDYSKELYIKKIGGYKLKGRNTYFDVALPSFKIQNPIVDEELKVVIKTNGNRDRDIEYHTLQNNIVKLFLSTDKVILEAQQINITFKLKKLIKEFSFVVIPSEIKDTPLKPLFKLNQWGVASNSEETWTNGNEIKGSPRINIGKGRHVVKDLDYEHRADNNYFIYLLSALANKKDSEELSYSNVLGLINLTKTYYDINKIDYTIDSYTSRNIIRNLIALEYLNKIKNEQNEDVFQIVPPKLLKLERSFKLGGNQIYKLAGVRSRRLDQVIIEYCKKNDVGIKYLDFKYEKNQQQLFEHLILPSMFFIDSNINIKDLNKFINQELGIKLLLQDEYHIGDSLLNFIESVNSFEKYFLAGPGDNYENQIFDEGVDPTLPRIIKSKNEFSRRGQFYKKRYLRISENNQNGIFSEDKILINWSKLYVLHKQQKAVLFLKRPKWSGKKYNFISDILIPKTLVLPSIFYKALTSINQGIPEIQRGFVVNASEIFEMQNKRFVYLDYYHVNIETKPERRENISRILTGSKEVLNNKQIAFYSEYEAGIRMFYSVCSTFSSVSELIIFRGKDDDIIALCDNYKNVYLKHERGHEITIDNQKIKVKKLIKDVTNTINNIFSLIITKNFDDLEFDVDIENKLVFENKKEEEIRILNLDSNA